MPSCPVPNAPCGVESRNHKPKKFLCLLFLMHRVELKDVCCTNGAGHSYKVPNAPCGVESLTGGGREDRAYSEFLMHRVELKGTKEA